jgi:hypothetical protein
MNESVDGDTADGDPGFPRRSFLTWVGAGVLAVGAGGLLAGCHNTASNDNNAPPDIDPPENDDNGDGENGENPDGGDGGNGDGGNGDGGGGDGGGGGGDG